MTLRNTLVVVAICGMASAVNAEQRTGPGVGRRAMSIVGNGLRNGAALVGRGVTAVRSSISHRGGQARAPRQEMKHFLGLSSRRGAGRYARAVKQEFKAEGRRAFWNPLSSPRAERTAAPDGSYSLKLTVSQAGWTRLRRRPIKKSERSLSFDAESGVSSMNVTRFNTNGSVKSSFQLTSKPDGTFRHVQMRSRRGNEVSATTDGTLSRVRGPLHRLDTNTSTTFKGELQGGVKRTSTTYRLLGMPVPYSLGRMLDRKPGAAGTAPAAP